MNNNLPPSFKIGILGTGNMNSITHGLTRYAHAPKLLDIALPRDHKLTAKMRPGLEAVHVSIRGSLLSLDPVNAT